MGYAPQFIEEFLRAGANIDLGNESYAPDFITKWVQIAKASGARLTIGDGYAPAFYQNWAQLGGNSVTFRLFSSDVD